MSIHDRRWARRLGAGDPERGDTEGADVRKEHAMAILDRFMAYAAAFEEAVTSDEWAPVGTFFTDDAVYQTVGPPPFGQRAEGRAAVLRYFKSSLDGFDRLWDTHEVSVLGTPEVAGDTVRFRWLEILRKPGLPDL